MPPGLGQQLAAPFTSEQAGSVWMQVHVTHLSSMLMTAASG
jgi:hypothetical protein